MKSVVIHDPSGALAVGELVDGDSLAVSRRRSAVMLPVDERVYNAGAPGFAYRPWGAGVLFDGMTPTRDCALVVAITPQTQCLYWSVLLRPIRSGEPMTGRLRLVGNSAAGLMSSGMTQEVLMPQLEGIAQEGKGLICTGRNHISILQEGVFGVSLYGVARNARVVWMAVTAAVDLVEIPTIVAI